MKVLVCGGRDYSNHKRVYDVLDGLAWDRRISLVIQGACPDGGADFFAECWAKSRECIYVGVPAEWKKHGRKAGPIRNAAMLKDWAPDLVIAFPGGRGTADMVKKAKDAGVGVVEVTDA